MKQIEERMGNGRLIEAILTVLKINRGGLTSSLIVEELAIEGVFPSDGSVKSTITNYMKQGLIKKSNRIPCETCGHPRNIYSITPLGLQRIGNNLHDNALAGS